MSLELAVRRLTFDSATAFGIYDRGLVQPGITVVNEVLLEKRTPTGNLPGRVLHNARYSAMH
jgi:N-acyl-D-aspartate/D-glutamate deacylase